MKNKALLLMILLLAAFAGCKKDEPAPEPAPEPNVCAKCQNQLNGKWNEPFCGKKTDVEIYLKAMDAVYYIRPEHNDYKHLYKCKYVTP